MTCPIQQESQQNAQKARTSTFRLTSQNYSRRDHELTPGPGGSYPTEKKSDGCKNAYISW